MTNPKKPEPNPIEEAIGERAKPKTVKLKTNYHTETIPQNLSEIADEPSPSEMLTLEELNRRTEERLRDEPIEEIPIQNQNPSLPVSKPDPLAQTKTSSPESQPPQEIKNFPALGTPEDQDREAQRQDTAPAEDVELTALRKYILEDGFVLSTVAFHIVTLCAQPMVTPSTTTWDFQDRASIPDMVLALLNQPGYLEGIWPSLKIVMGTNKGNSAWCSGIATTFAFFDTIRVLPSLEELKKCS